MSGAADRSPLEINGWRVYAHPVFLDQLEVLITEVETLRRKDPQGYGSKNASKRLAAIARLMLHDIPRDPGARQFQQGSTLGPDHRHWRRAKFFQQYRLILSLSHRLAGDCLGTGCAPTGSGARQSALAAAQRSDPLTVWRRSACCRSAITTGALTLALG